MSSRMRKKLSYCIEMRIIIANKFYYRRGGDCVYNLNLEQLLKAKCLGTPVKYSMYELPICHDYRDGKVTKEELDKRSTCDMNAIVNDGLKH